MNAPIIWNLVAIGLFMVIVYFMIIRPSQQQRQRYNDMMSRLQVGDDVILGSGLHGVIAEMNDRTVTLDCEGVYLVYERGAVARIVKPAETENTENIDNQEDDEA